ncbi:hypothetical protein SAMN05428967_3246 [Phyllobacterium sp. YR620]|uniref:hypothetical protein n=1 Tax=Phyllobacterium sp. YR620 TaxID=1881066 RepID=UPI0008858725|nr:hypothetical protein [Phyllobacterium sp. YR620]SDP72920.1 hypothetical protein SAMN05428967_3246 [Phyllobacterium sp. YR620]
MTRPRAIWMLKGLLAAALLFAAAVSTAIAAEEPELWVAGPYSFSDELGGFTIRSISGTGTLKDPIILTEEFPSATPTTLVIRTDRVALANPSEDAGILFYLQVRAINGSGHPWIEFEFELQEQLNVPSDYGDGLSFYQPGDKTDLVKSRGFAHYSDDFEPYDRLVFSGGKLDPGQNATFQFPIADFTPKRVFYLVQDPRIPSS